MWLTVGDAVGPHWLRHMLAWRNWTPLRRVLRLYLPIDVSWSFHWSRRIAIRLLTWPYGRRPRHVARHGPRHGIRSLLWHLRRRSAHHGLAPARWWWPTKDVGESGIALGGRRGGRTMGGLATVVATLLGLVLCHVACPVLVVASTLAERHPGLPRVDGAHVAPV